MSAMVKGDVEVPSEVTANKRFRAKHTDDCWIFPHISKLCNFYLAEVRGSKDACDLIGEGKPQSEAYPIVKTKKSEN